MTLVADLPSRAVSQNNWSIHPKFGVSTNDKKRKAVDPLSAKAKKKKSSEDVARKIAELSSSVEHLQALLSAMHLAPTDRLHTGEGQNVPPSAFSQLGTDSFPDSDVVSVAVFESQFTVGLARLGDYAQCKRPDVGENRVIVDDSGQETFPNGATVTFKCSIGYRPVSSLASKSITCFGTEWTKLELNCTKKSCGLLSDLSSGKYIYPNGHLFGATAEAQCNEGYMLVGQKTSNCRDNGWDGRDPVCEVVKCEPPPAIPNGEFEPVDTSYNYNQAVVYSCSGDYSLTGESTITCSDNGTFHPSPPQCKLVMCETPNIKNAVRVEGKPPPYRYKNFVRYQCIEGYTMTGSDYLVCDVNGWNPPPPECIPQCERPFLEGNRVLLDESGKDVFPEGATVTFGCSTGYQPVLSSSSRSITCSNKKWTELSLQCEKKSCGSPGEIANGRYKTPDGILFGATATAECNQGYMVAELGKTRNCRESGWDGRLAVCEVVKCQPPPSIQNGQFEFMDSYSYGDVVEYSCSKDYTLVGDSTVTCSENGTFHPSPPRCLVIKCDAPKINNAVRIEGRSPPYTYKQFVRYKCNEGYKMEGSDFLTCDVEGWTPPPPMCIRADLDKPTPGPSPPEGGTENPPSNKDKSHAVGVGIGVTVAVVLILGAVIIIVVMKKRSAWGKVPSRNEGGV
ncbi:zona pellucida sperm-binding protein 3 receptor-like [Neoarius graeffei]|uniref:zona pellucida sperm-binding protein 3 receptor-like n=1 Tax=Neoarius graeffei TaxID=443677 RepID=UPI00298CD606|nr:zona pellucida sperm-binding protein 3 receptor-like [Neoarius graeffei]